MSQSLSSQTKQWVAGIQDNEFRRIRREIQNYKFDDEASKSKSMLRLLIYLCQSAIKCPTTDHQTGLELSKLSTTICNNLTSIPDPSNYFSSLYHIIRVLLEMNLFEEAMSTCNNLLPSSPYHQQLQDKPETLSNNYSKLWSIFYFSIDKFLRNKKPGSITPPIFQQILTLIKYQLNIEEQTISDGSKTLLLKLLHYTELLEPLNCTKEEFDEFTDKFFLKYLSSIKLNLGDRNKSSTYQNFTKIITKLSTHYIKQKRLESLQKILRKFLKNFENCMLESRESSKCHQVFKEFIKIFMKSSKDHVKEDSERIKDLIEQFQTVVLSYGEDSLIKHNIYSISSILEALFNHWVDSPPPEFVASSAKLMNYLSEVIQTYQLESLCTCGNKTCLILQNKSKSVHLKNRILSILHRLHPKTKNPEFYDQFTLVSAQCVDMVQDLQRKKCDKWKNLWINSAASIYNFVFNLTDDHERSADLYKFLSTSLIRLKATEDDQIFFLGNPTSPLSLTLHRLSNLYYGNHQYHEARIYTAINVYLHPEDPECKGYRNWSFIHYQDPSTRGLTLVDFLKKNSSDLKVLGLDEIKLKKEVLRKICLREIKSHIGMKIDLSESIIAVLHRLEALNPDDITYATAVHQLGSHCLNFQHRCSIHSYLKNAVSRLKSRKVNNSEFDHIQYLISHLTLYEAVEGIRELEESTRAEMKDTSIKLYAVSSNGVSMKGSNVVPSFSQINVTTAQTLSSRLENIYNLWKKSFTLDSIKKWNSSDGTSTVKSVIIAGEYSRFYRYNHLEIKFWKMGYALAVETTDHQWIVYITGRAIISRYINDDWIEKSKKIISTELSSSKDSKVLSIISMFKMSLSDYYYYIGRTGEADKLFDEGKSVTPLNISENCGTFIFSQHLLLTHRFHDLPPEKKNNLEYTGILAHTLYAMLLIDDLAVSSRDVMWSLYEMDMLLEVSCNISSRMNSLYSFREITAHLSCRLRVCQPKISVLRVAEILKYLCIIDLSRNQLEDCEVKLQGLEHILQIETFEHSMQREFIKIPDSSLFPTAISPDRTLMDPMRDIPQNDTSPILRRERFAPPQFMVHEHKCKCFGCVNEAYKYLVFSCTHIRAQLYNLQNLKQYAKQHFEGALKISEGLLNLSHKEDNHQHYYVIDYIHFLLDYARFLKGSIDSYEEGRKIVCLALEICDIYKLECHPVYMSSMDMAFEYQFERGVPGVLPKSSLVIPRVDQIDISEHMESKDHTPESLCVTPAKESGNSPRPGSRSPRRRNQAPLLTLSKASVDVVESDSEELSPALLGPEKRKKGVTRVKPVRRRLVEDDDFDQEEESSRKSSEGGDMQGRVIKLIDGAISVAPDLSRKLHVLRKRVTDGGDGQEAVQKVIGILEEGKAEYEKPKGRSRSRRAIVSSEMWVMDVQGVEEILGKAKMMMGEGIDSGKDSRSSGKREKEDSSVASITKGIDKMKMGGRIASGISSRKPSRIPSITKGVDKTTGAGGIASGASSGKPSRIPSITKAVETLPVRTSGSRGRISRSSSTSSVQGITADEKESVNSDDEVVESSYIEPRRSKRLVRINSMTDTKINRKKL